MRNKLLESLKSSVKEEEEEFEKKFTKSIDNRFKVADSIFDSSDKKDHVIRDTFTLPKSDYDLIKKCKDKFLENKISITKSEIVRIGISLVSKLPNSEIHNVYKLMEKIKTGRPKQR